MNVYLFFVGLVMLLLSMDYFQRRSGYGLFMLVTLYLTILLVVMRYEVGYDYLNYVDLYQSDISELIDDKQEWGFVGVVGILQFLHADYFWMFCVLGASIILLMFRGAKLYTSNVRLAFLIYLLTPGLFLNSLSILRQAMAIVLLFNAFYYYYQKRYKAFLGFYLLGVLFHYSCLLVLPFFLIVPLMQKKARLIVLIGIPLSLLLSRWNLPGYLFSYLLGGTKFVFYAEFQDAGTSFIKLFILNLSVAIYLLFYKSMNELERSLLVLIGMGLMLLNICASVGAITRISYYFRIFEIVLLANMLSRFKKMPSQIIMSTCIIVYYFIMFYSSLAFDYQQVDTFPKMTPYQTILSR